MSAANRVDSHSVRICFTYFFEVSEASLAAYRAFNGSLINDIPLLGAERIVHCELG